MQGEQQPRDTRDRDGHAFATLVRGELQRLRALGLPFGEAWDRALARYPAPFAEDGVAWHWQCETVNFMLRHYRAAYNRMPCGKPFLVEPPEAPEADELALRRSEQTERTLSETSARDGMGNATLTPPERHCHWGGNRCAGEGGHGTFGKFCSEHAGVLARIAEMPGMREFITARAERAKARHAAARQDAA